MRALLVIATACMAAATLACGQSPAPTTSLPGYLTEQTAPDAALILPPPPAQGSPGDLADRAFYQATRSMAGTPRWALAITDADATIPGMYDHFACALGMRLTPQTAPRLTLLLRRLARDNSLTTNHAKHVFLRPRPFVLLGGNICIPHDNSLDTSLDYPSGHANFSWSIGLILAEIAPDRATPILTRARAFGEGRAICGVHFASAIGAGRTTGAALVAAEHGSAEFRSDLDGARQELARLRADPSRQAPDAGACRAEADLISHPPFAG
jgi:acid phosphatase (class A)